VIVVLIGSMELRFVLGTALTTTAMTIECKRIVKMLLKTLKKKDVFQFVRSSSIFKFL